MLWVGSSIHGRPGPLCGGSWGPPAGPGPEQGWSKGSLQGVHRPGWALPSASHWARVSNLWITRPRTRADFVSMFRLVLMILAQSFMFWCSLT